jgi:hypothetical protein
MDGWVAVGFFSDGNAGPALGMGCFTGQSQKIGLVKDLVGARATPEQIAAYLAKLTVAPSPMARRLTSVDVESKLGAAARQAKAEEAARLKKGEEARAARERKRKESIERDLADAKAAEDKARADREKAERALAEADPDSSSGTPAALGPDEPADARAPSEPATLQPAKSNGSSGAPPATAAPAEPPLPVKAWHGFCLLEDTLGGRGHRRGSSPEDDGAPAYISNLFTIEISGQLEREKIYTQFDAHLRSVAPVSAEARPGWCFFDESMAAAQKRHGQILQDHPQGASLIGGNLYSKIAKYRLSQIAWEPSKERPVTTAQVGTSPGASQPASRPAVPPVEEPASRAEASLSPIADPAVAEAARVAELRARDEAAAAEGAARLKAYHDQVEAQRAAHEAEVARVTAANAEAQRRHQAAVAESKRKHEEAMAAWRARAAACQAGDRSQCAAQ